MKKSNVNFHVDYHDQCEEVYTIQTQYDPWGDMTGMDVYIKIDCPMEGEHMPLRMLQSHLNKLVYALDKRLPRDAA